MTDTWADLFDRSEAADATLAAVRERFGALRADADPTEATGVTDPGKADEEGEDG